MNARHEFKHIINFGDYLVLRNRLRVALPKDRHVGSGGEYLVRSLYFDTPRDTALREKIDGVNRREKFRIRCYNADPSFIRLEKKSKVNGLCYKQSAPLTEAQTRAIIAGDIEWMATEEEPLIVELYAKITGDCLRPKTVVDYTREPFVFSAGNVRITLDRNIRTGLRSTDIFSSDLPTVDVSEGQVVLEVKYDAFIPQVVVDLLQIGDRKASAYSKYALCRTFG